MKATKIKATKTNDNDAKFAEMLASMTSEELKVILGAKFEAIEPQSKARFVMGIHNSKIGNQCIKVSLIDSSKKKPYEIYLTVEMAQNILDNTSGIASLLKQIAKKLGK